MQGAQIYFRHAYYLPLHWALLHGWEITLGMCWLSWKNLVYFNQCIILYNKSCLFLFSLMHSHLFCKATIWDDLYSGVPLRDHFVYAPSQWETALQCNFVSHWRGTYTKRSLPLYSQMCTLKTVSVCFTGGHFKNAYKLLNLRALKISILYKNHIFQCMGKIFYAEFQRLPLKFHTKYLTRILKDEDFIHRWKLKSS